MATGRTARIADEALVTVARALSHPTWLQALRLIGEQGRCSPKEIAMATGISLGTAPTTCARWPSWGWSR
jgi:hypothetical protein